MTKTFQEISNALEASNLSLFMLDKAEGLLNVFANSDEYNTEGEAVTALIENLRWVQENNDKFLQSTGAQQRFVVVARLDGDETIILSREVRAASKEEAEAEFISELENGNPTLKDQFDLEVTYGPY